MGSWAGMVGVSHPGQAFEDGPVTAAEEATWQLCRALAEASLDGAHATATGMGTNCTLPEQACSKVMPGATAVPIAVSARDDLSCEARSGATDQSILHHLPLPAWPLIFNHLSGKQLLLLSLASQSLRQLLLSIPGLWQQACTHCLSQTPRVIDEQQGHDSAKAAAVAGPAGDIEAAQVTAEAEAEAAAAAAASSYHPQSNQQQQQQLPPFETQQPHEHNHMQQQHSKHYNEIVSQDQAQQQQQQQQQQTMDSWSCPSDSSGLQILSAAAQLLHIVTAQKWLLKPLVYNPPPWLPAIPGRSRGFEQVEGPSLDPPLDLSQEEAYWLSLGCPVGTFRT